jgi:hypothetical protein
MANDNNLFEIKRKYNEKLTVGGQIQYVLDSRFRGTAIPLRTILEIVCKFTQDGECKFFELKHGSVNKPIRVLIDKKQYDELKVLMDA